jgi:hypothetical protein
MVYMAEGTNVGALKEVFRTNAPYSGGRTCGGGGCPAIYETDDGVFLIVGRKLTAEEKMGLSMDAICVRLFK